jgi:hypothetical protein
MHPELDFPSAALANPTYQPPLLTILLTLQSSAPQSVTAPLMFHGKNPITQDIVWGKYVISWD